MAAQQLSRGAADGAVLGQSASDKVALHGAAPVAQAANIAAVASTAATSSTPFGFSEAQANAIVSNLNAIRTALINKGIIAAA